MASILLNVIKFFSHNYVAPVIIGMTTLSLLQQHFKGIFIITLLLCLCVLFSLVIRTLEFLKTGQDDLHSVSIKRVGPTEDPINPKEGK